MRLVDADALAKFIDYGHLNNPNEKLYSENDIREMIDMMPTVDAVEVVRCKDCRHWIKDGKICCGQTTVGEDESSVITGENDFCSMGERWRR